jgi:N-carbamoyl-L-amino-acid hydrolase
MIFVPSKDGISHNPGEHTDEESLLQGSSVLLEVSRKLVVG